MEDENVKKILIIVMIIASSVQIYGATVFTESSYFNKEQDLYLYINLNVIKKFAYRNNIKTTDLLYSFIENNDLSMKEEAGVKFLFNNSIRMLAAGQLHKNKMKGVIALEVRKPIENLYVLLGKPKTRIIEGRTMLQISKKNNIYLTRSHNVYVLGSVGELTIYMKNRRNRRITNSSGLSLLKKNSQRALYYYLKMSKRLKTLTKNAVKKQTGANNSIDSNVFVKALIEMKSLEFYVDLNKTLMGGVLFKGKSVIQGERLEMFAHSLIVGSSIALTVFDIYSSTQKKKKKLSPWGKIKRNNDLKMIQGILGRIRTQRARRGVRLWLILNAREHVFVVKALKETIAIAKVNALKKKEKRMVTIAINAMKAKDHDLAMAQIRLIKDLNLSTKKGACLIHEAVSSGNLKIFYYLIERGVDVNKNDRIYNSSPLMLSLKKRNIAMASLLVVKGADLTVRDQRGNTVVHHAVILGKRSLLTSIIRKKASVDIGNFDGNKPLHVAVKKGDLAIVKILVKAGASIETYNYKGETPMSIAKKMNYRIIVRFLQSIVR